MFGSTYRPAVIPAAAFGTLAFLCLTAFSKQPVAVIIPAVAAIVILIAIHEALLSWRGLVALMILVIFFVPIYRYALPGNLPFQLELYRVVVALVAALWLTSLLIDPRVRLRRSGFERPIALFLIGVVGSLLANPTRVNALQSEVLKHISYFASFLIVYFLIVSVARTHADIDALLKVVVFAGTVVAIAAVIQARTGYNVFDHLRQILPILRPVEATDVTFRGGLVRAYASSQHPIELGAVLMLLCPLALYLGRRTHRRRWWFAAIVIAIATLSTVSRTSLVMLVVILFVFARHRPTETKRLWPLLVPALLAAHLVLPGAIGTITQSFFPKGGLIGQQQHRDARGSGRLANLGPGLREFAQRPLVGEGFGTRVIDALHNGYGATNTTILDDQWLGTMLETGALGAGGLMWFFIRMTRRLRRAAKGDDSDRGWLFTALDASVAAFAIGMVMFDAFSFVQVTFLAFILLAFSAVMLRTEEPVPESAPLPALAPAT